MNLRKNLCLPQRLFLVGGACAFSILFSLTLTAMAQCQNGAAMPGAPVNTNGTAGGIQNANVLGFGNNGFQATNAQQGVMQNMFQAQLMNMLMQQGQQRNMIPQPTAFNRNVNQTPRTNVASNQALERILIPRDPDRPLTKEEERLEARRVKEQEKREAYQARIDAKELRMADLKARLEN